MLFARIGRFGHVFVLGANRVHDVRDNHVEIEDDLRQLGWNVIWVLEHRRKRGIIYMWPVVTIALGHAGGHARHGLAAALTIAGLSEVKRRRSHAAVLQHSDSVCRCEQEAAGD